VSAETHFTECAYMGSNFWGVSNFYMKEIFGVCQISLWRKFSRCIKFLFEGNFWGVSNFYMKEISLWSQFLRDIKLVEGKYVSENMYKYLQKKYIQIQWFIKKYFSILFCIYLYDKHIIVYKHLYWNICLSKFTPIYIYFFRSFYFLEISILSNIYIRFNIKIRADLAVENKGNWVQTKPSLWFTLKVFYQS